MFYKTYRFVRKNILFFGLAILLMSIFINIPIYLVSKNKIYTSLNDFEKKEYGLLLGTSRYMKSGKKNSFYYYRISAAEKLLKAKKIDKIILSGFKDIGYDEVEWMKNDLLKRGISLDKMILDKNAKRTNDSIKNNLKYGAKNILVISQKFHLERAIFLAKLQGEDLYGFKANSPDFWAATPIYIREIFSRIKIIFFDIFLVKFK